MRMDSGENMVDQSDSLEGESAHHDAVGTSANALKICVLVRWMIRRDMPEVLEIEQESFEFPWSKEDYIRCLRQRNCIGMIAELGERVVGVMVYELQETSFQLLNFAVHRELRRRNIGTALMSKLQNKLSPQRRDSIFLEVRETNLPAQLFFRNQGFRAISVLRDLYEETPEDAYVMRYQYQDKKGARDY